MIVNYDGHSHSVSTIELEDAMNASGGSSSHNVNGANASILDVSCGDERQVNALDLYRGLLDWFKWDP